MWSVTYTKLKEGDHTEILALFRDVEEALRYIDMRVAGDHVKYQFNINEKRIKYELNDGTYYTLIG